MRYVPVNGSASTHLDHAGARERPQSQRTAYLDAARIVAALFIFTYHFSWDYQTVLGPAKVMTLGLTPVWRIAHELASWGIALFIVISGFALATSMSRRSQHYGVWVNRRLRRLLIPFWIVAVPYLCIAFATHEWTLSDSWKLPIWLSGFGAVSPATYLPPSQAWWYVSLALQLAVLAPALWFILETRGPILTAALCAAATLSWLLWVRSLPPQWHYLTQGAAPARLIEFGLGMTGAWYVSRQPTRDTATRLLCAASVLVASSLVAQKLGARTTAIAIATIALLMLASCLAGGFKAQTPLTVAAIAEATYVFYLSHPPVSRASMEIANWFGTSQPWLLLLTCFAAACVVAGMFWWLYRNVMARIG